MFVVLQYIARNPTDGQCRQMENNVHKGATRRAFRGMANILWKSLKLHIHTISVQTCRALYIIVLNEFYYC